MTGSLVYANPLASASDVADWVAEGPARAEDVDGAVALRSGGDPDAGHFTLWCPAELPDRVRIAWDFRPIAEPGLAMLFFGATGVDGRSVLDPVLAPRDGSYPQYHSGDIRTLHVSYFRRRWDDERAFHTCNLRKSPGFHLVAQGADPIPSADDARDRFYRVEVVKDGPRVAFSVYGLPLFSWVDDGSTGPTIGGGRIGFRQMAPLIAHYRDLEVWTLD